jgi:hypothetical protein
MRKILSSIVILFSIAILFAGCKKNEINYGETEAITGKALLKINYVSGYAANPSVQLSINNTRVSNLITSRTPFPGGGFNTGGGSTPDYLAVNPGNLEISVAIPKRLTNTDSVLLHKSSIKVEENKNYTVHITDTAANTKAVLTVDDLTIPEEGKARYKFVHLMPNVPALDLYFGTTKVASNIAYLGVSDYFEVAVPTSATAWNIREAGTSATSTALATYSSASTYTNRRVYTTFALGYKGITSTTDARRPFVSFFLNK